MHSINITPLTDVLLVLLITFLLSATSFQEPPEQVLLPRLAEPREVAEKTTRLVVTSAGEIVWPQASLAQLTRPEAFETLRATATEPILALAVHRDLPYEQLYRLLIDARQGGWEQMVILTEKRL